MDSNSFYTLFKQVQSSLSSGSLLDALQSLESILYSHQEWPANAQLRKLCDEYDMMLSYMRKNVKDPERHNLFKQFIERAYKIADSVYFSFSMTNPSCHFYDLNLQKTLLNKDSDMTELFRTVSTLAIDDSRSIEQLKTLVYSNIFDVDKQKTIINALFLSLLSVYDEEKLWILLYYITTDHSIEINARAWICVILLVVKYYKRIISNNKVKTKVLEILALKHCEETLHIIQIQLILSLQTKKDSDAIKESIMPSLLKITESFNASNLTDTIQSVKEKIDFNPEWQDKINDKMNEYIKLQEKGVDTFYSTFANIIHHYPFFRKIENWFVPFDRKHAQLGKKEAVADMIDLLMEKRKISDTEKYAMCFMVSSVPEQQLNLLSSGLLDMAKMMKETKKTEERNEHQIFIDEVRCFMQDLYRFFSLFSYKNEEWENPFKLNLCLIDCPLFTNILGDNDNLLSFANFCFSEQAWGMAYYYYSKIEERECNAEIYQKRGYCSVKLGNIGDAVTEYEKALLLVPEDKWSLKQLGIQYFKENNYPLAISCFQELDNLSKEQSDLNVLLMLGECHLKLGNIDKAFETYYKADYLYANVSSKRALAWVSLVAEKYEQAQTLYSDIINNNESTDIISSDYMNAGHIYWILGNAEEAVKQYKRYLQKEALDLMPANFFNSDKPLLIKAGKSEEDLLLMRDLVNSL